MLPLWFGRGGTSWSAMTFNDRSTPLSLLRTRRSGKPRDLALNTRAGGEIGVGVVLWGLGRHTPYSSFGFALVHNHPSGCVSPSDADLRLTKRIASGARILQIKFLDHVIVGQALAGRPGYFSFQEAGLL